MRGNSPGNGEFPAQMASNAENVSIWWCHHAVTCTGWHVSDCSSYRPCEGFSRRAFAKWWLTSPQSVVDLSATKSLSSKTDASRSTIDRQSILNRFLSDPWRIANRFPIIWSCYFYTKKDIFEKGHQTINTNFAFIYVTSILDFVKLKLSLANSYVNVYWLYWYH